MNKKNIIILIISILSVSGCLVSGTFMIVETFTFTTQTGFYHNSVDLTTNDIWIEHADKLDDIELVGFELWITNNETSSWTYTAFIDDYDPNCTTQLCFDNSSSKKLVFGPISVPAGTGSSGTQRYVTYAESFGFLQNVEALKAAVFTGKLNLIGIAVGGAGGNGGSVDSLKIIATLAASDT